VKPHVDESGSTVVLGTRRRGPRPVLSLDAIVEAALDQLRDGGIDSVTMKTVAERIGVGTMSLYYYVPDKAALLCSMVGRLYSGITLPDGSMPWRERIEQLANQVFEVHLNAPGLDPHHVLMLPMSDSLTGTIDVALHIWLEAGLPAEEAMLATRAVFGLASEFGAFAARRQQLEREHPELDSRIGAEMTGGRRFLFVEQLGPSGIAVPYVEVYRYALTVMLDGIAARVPKVTA
jgi:AcrR family transcriptional regulator